MATPSDWDTRRADVKSAPPRNGNHRTTNRLARELSNVRTFERLYSLRSGRFRTSANHSLAALRLKSIASCHSSRG